MGDRAQKERMELEDMVRLIQSELGENKRIGKEISEGVKNACKLISDKINPLSAEKEREAMDKVRNYVLQKSSRNGESRPVVIPSRQDALPPEPDQPAPADPMDVDDQAGQEPVQQPQVPRPRAIQLKQSSLTVVAEKFKKFYWFAVMCIVDESFESRIGEAQWASVKEAVESVVNLKLDVTHALGRAMHVERSNDESYSRALQLMGQTTTVKFVKHEEMEKAGECQITRQKARKGQCWRAIFVLENGPQIVYVVSTEWLNFFKKWAMLIRGAEIIKSSAARKLRERENAEAAAKPPIQRAQLVCTRDDLEEASKRFREPLSFFYKNYIHRDGEVRDTLLSKHEKHWFE